MTVTAEQLPDELATRIVGALDGVEASLAEAGAIVRENGAEWVSQIWWYQTMPHITGAIVFTMIAIAMTIPAIAMYKNRKRILAWVDDGCDRDLPAGIIAVFTVLLAAMSLVVVGEGLFPSAVAVARNIAAPDIVVADFIIGRL